VLENACEQGVRLNTRFGRSEPLAISVNLSVRQLRSDAIVSDVRCALEKSGFPAESLVLEITETVVMADTEFAVQRLRELKSLGVRLAMDDFGTGYSSLSFLSRFPVDILKIDRSFVRAGENTALTSAIVALGMSLDLDVIAEGIEIAGRGCCPARPRLYDGQGFLYGPSAEHGGSLQLPLLALGKRGRRWEHDVQCNIVTKRSTASAASRGAV